MALGGISLTRGQDLAIRHDGGRAPRQRGVEGQDAQTLPATPSADYNSTHASSKSRRGDRGNSPSGSP